MNYVITNPLFMGSGPAASGTFAQAVEAAKTAAAARGESLSTTDFRKLDETIICGFELVAIGNRETRAKLREIA